MMKPLFLQLTTENDAGETTLIVETDEPLAMRVFDEYYKLLDEQNKK